MHTPILFSFHCHCVGSAPIRVWAVEGSTMHDPWVCIASYSTCICFQSHCILFNMHTTSIIGSLRQWACIIYCIHTFLSLSLECHGVGSTPIRFKAAVCSTHHDPCMCIAVYSPYLSVCVLHPITRIYYRGATISRLLKITGLFCRISSLL